MAQQTQAGEEVLWSHVRPRLDAALAALPAAQRDAIVLQYLGGKSRREVARALGCSEFTIQTRVKRGLARLRAGLARTGVAVSPAVLAAFLGQRCLEAVPAGLVGGVQSVCLGKAAASAAAAAATKGTMQAMALAKVKLVAAALAVTAAAGVGGGVLYAEVRGGDASTHAGARWRSDTGKAPSSRST